MLAYYLSQTQLVGRHAPTFQKPTLKVTQHSMLKAVNCPDFFPAPVSISILVALQSPASHWLNFFHIILHRILQKFVPTEALLIHPARLARRYNKSDKEDYFLFVEKSILLKNAIQLEHIRLCIHLVYSFSLVMLI